MNIQPTFGSNLKPPYKRNHKSTYLTVHAWRWDYTKRIQGQRVIHSGWSSRSVGELVGDETMKEKQEQIVVLTVASFNAFELGTRAVSLK